MPVDTAADKVFKRRQDRTRARGHLGQSTAAQTAEQTFRISFGRLTSSAAAVAGAPSELAAGLTVPALATISSTNCSA